MYEIGYGYAVLVSYGVVVGGLIAGVKAEAAASRRLIRWGPIHHVHVYRIGYFVTRVTTISNTWHPAATATDRPTASLRLAYLQFAKNITFCGVTNETCRIVEVWQIITRWRLLFLKPFCFVMPSTLTINRSSSIWCPRRITPFLPFMCFAPSDVSPCTMTRQPISSWNLFQQIIKKTYQHSEADFICS